MSLSAENAIRQPARWKARAQALAEVRRRSGSKPSVNGALKLYEEARPGSILGISNRRDTAQSRPTVGTISFYAMVNGTARCEVVLVSNRHVLLAAGGSCGDSIYRCSGGQHMTCDPNPVAHVSDEGGEENHCYTYPGEASAEYFVDCATATFLHKESSPPVATQVLRPARVHPLDILGRRSYYVRKLGNATGLTEGRVLDVSATVRTIRGSRARNLVIRGTGGRFAEPGDSGALVLNDRDEAVGLLWGRDDNDPDIAYACHIHPVLNRLGVTMMTRGMPCGIERMGGSI